jgi:hypothetical protein
MSKGGRCCGPRVGIPRLKILSATKLLFAAWRQADRRFKIGGLFLLTAFVIDVVATAVSYGRIETLWRPEMLAALVAVAFFYVFLAPLTMHIMYLGALKDLHRHQDAKSVLVYAILIPTLIFISVHVYYSISIKGAITTTP